MSNPTPHPPNPEPSAELLAQFANSRENTFAAARSLTAADRRLCRAETEFEAAVDALAEATNERRLAREESLRRKQALAIAREALAKDRNRYLNSLPDDPNPDEEIGVERDEE